MADDLGNPFQEIKGPGVWMVEAMAELEDKLEKIGIEVEYQVADDDEKFSWP